MIRQRRSVMLLTSALWGLGAATFGGSASAQSSQQPTYQFDIPAEPLGQALTDLSTASSQQIIMSAAVAGGRTTKGLHGRYTVQQALELLLAGTDLRVETNASGVLMVRPKNAQAASTEGAAETSSNDQRVETVIVTAEKREQNIQDVPASVSVLTGAELAAMHAVSLQDMAGYIPGMTIQPDGGAGREYITLAGIPPLSPTASARVYIDETPIGSSSAFVSSINITPDLMPYDISRVEVLAGPQGTLYGANAMSGLVKYVLTKPDLTEFSGEAGGDLFGVSGGGGVGETLRGMVNIPVIDDELGVRMSAYQQFTPGYINDVITGSKHDNAVHEAGGRFSVLWEPTSKLSIEATALYQDTLQVNTDEVQYNYTTHQPFAGGGVLSNIAYLPQKSENQLQLYSVTAKWDFDWANLTSVSSYQEFHNNQLTDETQAYTSYFELIAALEPALGLPPVPSSVYITYTPTVNKFTQEVRLASPSNNAFEWLIGGYFTHETTTFPEDFVVVPFGQAEWVGQNTSYAEWAGFGDATWHITDSFDLAGGVRYSYNDQHYMQPEGGPLFGTKDWVAAETIKGGSDDSVVTWDVNPSYHIDQNNMVYVRIATGYQPGAPNALPPGVTGIPASYSSSTLIDYEGGIKSIFLDGKVVADLSVYDIDWNRIQVPEYFLACGCSVTVNGSTARSEGVTLTAHYSPIEGVVLGVNVDYDDAAATGAFTSLGTGAGARLPDVPLWAYSLTANYTTPIDARWKFDSGIGYRYGGRSWSQVEGATSGTAQLAFSDPSYGLVDLHAGVSDASWKIAIYVKNLTNDVYLRGEGNYETGLGGFYAFGGYVSQPRTFGISVDKSF